jgi:hypothetical protein
MEDLGVEGSVILQQSLTKEYERARNKSYSGLGQVMGIFQYDHKLPEVSRRAKKPSAPQEGLYSSSNGNNIKRL